MFDVSGTGRTMISWHKQIGEFENSRGNMHWFLFYAIMFVFYLIDKLVRWLSWQTLKASTSKTWVRTPGLYYVHIIFPLEIMCRRNFVDHHTLAISSRPRV